MIMSEKDYQYERKRIGHVTLRLQWPKERLKVVQEKQKIL